VLAIVAPSFNQYSETFIAYHARMLAPGRTVLVCKDSLGAHTYGYPVLSHVNPKLTHFNDLDRRAKWVLFAVRARYSRGLSFDDRMRVMDFFRTQGVEKVLGEFGYSGAIMTDICRKLDLPLYVFFRGQDASSFMRRRSWQRRYRRMFQSVAGVFCVSQYLADRVVQAGCPEHLIHISPSGVVLEDFPPGTPEPGRLIAVGRLVEKKAPDLTLEAFARIAAAFPDAHLGMIGDGPLADRCREVVARHGLQHRVTLYGALQHQEVAALMRRASVFVQHSVTAPNGDIEGFPTAIAEAMAVGLPVVATRHSGIPEHVHEGESGLLVDEGDVAGMSRAIEQLLADPDLARRMGRAARIHAERNLDRSRLLRQVREVIGLAPEPLKQHPKISEHERIAY
jgi:colanic acid/amylovoran biosynthesis glycosyltransferase